MTAADFKIGTAKRNRMKGREKQYRAAARAKRTGMLTAGTIQKRPQKKQGTKNDKTQEHTFYNSQDGTLMKKNLANVYKILAAQSTKNYYEFNAATKLFGPNGFIGMSNTATATTAGLSPVVAVDLTACINQVNGSTQVPSLYFSQLASGTPQTLTTTVGSKTVYPVNFQQLPQLANMFVANSTTPANVEEMYPMEKDRLLWSDIRLQLYGALNVPMTWHIYFVQFKKSYLCPNADVTAGTADERVERAAFWQNLTKPLLYNPILVQDQKHMRDVRVIKHDQFHLAPAENTETLVNPHVKTVKYFERWNKLCNYAWSDMANVSFAGDGDTQRSVAETRTTVEDRDRVYMLLMSEAFTPGAFSNTVNASFDIMVKNCHERSL